MQDEALAIARQLGMRPLEARLERLTMRLTPLPQSGRHGYPASLTPREVEVLRLVAAGRMNRQIAEELFISYNTVTVHVKNILGKTGAANRAELAAFAVRNGLADA